MYAYVLQKQPPNVDCKKNIANCNTTKKCLEKNKMMFLLALSVVSLKFEVSKTKKIFRTFLQGSVDLEKLYINVPSTSFLNPFLQRKMSFVLGTVQVLV